MLQVLLIVAVLFGLIFMGRLAGAKRATVFPALPAILLAAAALFALARGYVWVAAGLAAFTLWAWATRPGVNGAAKTAAPTARDEAQDVEARSILGVGPAATADEIRRAYRARMAQAHPDRGGAHAEAARLTAARDRLLRRGRS